MNQPIIDHRATHYPVYIENNNPPFKTADRYLVGYIPISKARPLFNLCYQGFDWGICFEEMELEKRGEFTVNACEMQEAIHYAATLARYIRIATEHPTNECTFTIAFTVQGCPRKGELGLDYADYRAAIEKRMNELDSDGNLEWQEAVTLIESRRENEGGICHAINQELEGLE